MSDKKAGEESVAKTGFYGSTKNDYLSPMERKRLRMLSFSDRTPSSFENTKSVKKPPRKIRKKLTHKARKENEAAIDLVLPIRSSPERPRETNKFFRNIDPSRNAQVRFTPKRGIKFAPTLRPILAANRKPAKKLLPKYVTKGLPATSVLVKKLPVPKTAGSAIANPSITDACASGSNVQKGLGNGFPRRISPRKQMSSMSSMIDVSNVLKDLSKDLPRRISPRKVAQKNSAAQFLTPTKVTKGRDNLLVTPDITPYKGVFCSTPIHGNAKAPATPVLPDSGQSFSTVANSVTPVRRSIQMNSKELGHNNEKGPSVINETRPPVMEKKKYLSKLADPKQMILDAGQKRFGATQCAECGLLYSQGEQEDEENHREYHQRSKGVLTFKGWKREHGLEGYSDGRIIRVLPKDPKNHLKRVAEILQFSSGNDSEEVFNAKNKADRQYFIFVLNSKYVGGIVIVEKISSAHRVSLGPNNEFCCENESVVCELGVRNIWTAPWYRRKKVASRLVDAARKWYFLRGEHIDWDNMAFADPTPEGRQLAASLTGRLDFLVYSYSNL